MIKASLKDLSRVDIVLSTNLILFFRSIFIYDQTKFSNVYYFLVSLKRSLSEYQLGFKERTITDYAVLEDSIGYDLDATTVCFFAKDTDHDKPTIGTSTQCVYSYAVTGQTNALNFCTYPALRVLINGVKRYSNLY